MRLLAYVLLSAWIMGGMAMYCHRHDLQDMRQAIQDNQGRSILEELK